MAPAGYGKRSAPAQNPRRKGDFSHLPAREAAIATYIDRLPEGAAIDVKTLAKELAAYGQQAVRTALNALTRAGHLFRRRETVGEGRTQWVFRTYFSRTARDESWWRRFLRGDVPAEAEPTPTEEAPPPAYRILAAVGGTDPRMALSATECAQLTPLAEEWLARGATESELVRALTTGLPPEVHSPGALARTRLKSKLPPQRVQAPPPPTHLTECEGCGAPARALPGGRCRACRDDGPNEGWLGEEFDEEFHRQVAAVRAGISTFIPRRR
ncbi:hypothetical protein ACH427_20395 [Streptomyces sp. NPDC020379]|uniref:hypothetical protein n=1 Tax=Streptomyces sp. NPDC020379 TaxID=3365071 RepID=UPI0037A5925A